MREAVLNQTRHCVRVHVHYIVVDLDVEYLRVQPGPDFVEVQRVLARVVGWTTDVVVGFRREEGFERGSVPTVGRVRYEDDFV
jgi:hypothetical protein